ncbi:MAG: hypothetical protein OEZ58_22145 [Gammaproteobacteria bacterium]|nr:hypothetical protein [Gammaproteobacteria bacterium]
MKILANNTSMINSFMQKVFVILFFSNIFFLNGCVEVVTDPYEGLNLLYIKLINESDDNLSLSNECVFYRDQSLQSFHSVESHESYTCLIPEEENSVLLSGESRSFSRFVIWSSVVAGSFDSDFHSFKFKITFDSTQNNYVIAGWPENIVQDDEVDEYGFAYVGSDVVNGIRSKLDTTQTFGDIYLVVTVFNETDVRVEIDNENSP